jgi:hypothetical protein
MMMCSRQISIPGAQGLYPAAQTFENTQKLTSLGSQGTNQFF